MQDHWKHTLRRPLGLMAASSTSKRHWNSRSSQCERRAGIPFPWGHDLGSCS